MSISAIEDIVTDLKQGRMVILVDEEDRENEGDLVLAADFVTAEAINFMATHGRGLICLTLTEEKCHQLDLPLMVSANRARLGTNFTLSIEAASGVTTGISAADRAHTIRVAARSDAKPHDIVQPGHIFPLMAQKGGVLVRAGHTEAGCDLARMAGLNAASVICEILKPDGSMARLPDLIEFAEKHQIPVAKDKRGEAPFSVDANLLHSSSEGKVLEDPAVEPPPYVYQRTISPMEAPDQVTEIEIGFEKGDAVSLNGKKLSPATLLAALNDLGRDNGIGRLDLVENRFVGMKSRGVYETPGGTILLQAHRAIESITLDRGAGHLKDELMPRYAELIYNGFWFAPEREMLQAAIDKSQSNVSGTVSLKLYKGNVIVTGRASPNSLYSAAHVTFEDDAGAYDQKDAQGFIKLNALRLRTLGSRKRK